MSPPVGAAMKSARRFRASTHLAASIASEDPFTKRAVEEIKEAITTDESIQHTTDDLQKDNNKTESTHDAQVQTEGQMD